MGTIKSDILKQVLSARGMTLQQLADLSDIPVETLRNFYYDKISEPKASTILKLSKALDLSMNYLCGDLQRDDDEFTLLCNFRKSSHRGKAVIQLFARVESELTEKERSAEKYIIPCLIPIGKITDGIKYHSCDSVMIETDLPDAFIAIQIMTNHFAPAYCSGDRILLENRFPEDGERAVFLRDGIAYFRRFVAHDDGYELHCLNGRGHDLHFKRMDQVECIGTLIGVIRS